MSGGKLKKFAAALRIFAVAFCLAAISGQTRAAADTNQVTVYAAASTTNALTDIAALHQQKTGVEVALSFASSSTLAKQIEQGAPAQIFLSADLQWMDYLYDRGIIEWGSRHNLLGNRLALIAPRDSPLDSVKIERGFDLKRLLGDGYLAMGDPDHVPAGKYGKAALEYLNAWAGVENKIARAKDVRAALALVERGESPLGIVYTTDAAISDKVKVVGLFPERSHAPIIYPVALVKGNATPEAKKFLQFMQGPEAATIFKKYGFAVL